MKLKKSNVAHKPNIGHKSNLRVLASADQMYTLSDFVMEPNFMGSGVGLGRGNRGA